METHYCDCLGGRGGTGAAKRGHCGPQWRSTVAQCSASSATAPAREARSLNALLRRSALRAPRFEPRSELCSVSVTVLHRRILMKRRMSRRFPTDIPCFVRVLECCPPGRSGCGWATPWRAGCLSSSPRAAASGGWPQRQGKAVRSRQRQAAHAALAYRDNAVCPFAAAAESSCVYACANPRVAPPRPRPAACLVQPPEPVPRGVRWAAQGRGV